ncbi:MAG TPA: glucoamylase family protein, partial [Casimicrobiaceae bacterium]|nr:glucoamylase family protein [Casimicrobiaceae bacterium]
MTRLTAWLRNRLPSSGPIVEEAPLRSELLSADQMERYGATLAARHRVIERPSQDLLLRRLAANETALVAACARLTAAVSANHRISPAGDWLLDNFHLIEEQISMAKRHLPRGYSRALPRLTLGPSSGLPRVYDIALEAIAHGDGRVDADGLRRFIAAYQTVTVLKLGELWAIPIMLRLALIENLRRVAAHIAGGRVERDLANAWADRMMHIVERDPKSLILVIADMARSDPPTGSAFVAELARRLQGQSAALALALTWIEQRLSESHVTIDQLVQLENQRQASDQISISNSISSLRLLTAIDWRGFVEGVSEVENVLRQDPQRVYDRMDFATRDCYRHATERIARQGRLDEVAVAGHAIELARTAATREGLADRSAHVGYYLVDRGLFELERVAEVRISHLEALGRFARRFALPVYLGAIALITGSVTAFLAVKAFAGGANEGVLAVLVAASLLATSQLAATIVSWLVTLLVMPRMLPRMDFSVAIPAQARTLVVVPTMLDRVTALNDLVDALEVRFLANRDPHLHFALLTDFSDAPRESLPNDEYVLGLAEAGINALNRKYRRDKPPPESGTAGGRNTDDAIGESVFYLFHRPRRWNAQARTWMGEERKRGKLGDLNAFLRGGHPHDFSLIVGETAILTQVKYVITLDTDTELPRDAARQFVGAMAHPLNTARFGERGEETQREVVTSGHGILQPRVSASLPGTNRSRYARLYGGQPGIDQYTRTVSDVYQDVFDEGSFIGKGIYDVDAVERALKGRLPANRILSHDLLEGCYARAGLLSDVELYEAFPARYSADVARRRRWIRGDWQLAGWLGRRVSGPDGSSEPNPLSMLSQWKLTDNLRRSLVPLALASLLLLGWMALSPAWFWTALVLAVIALPSVIATLTDLWGRTEGVSLPRHLADVNQAAVRHGLQAVLALAFLPYESYFCLDAIVRTLGRLLITRRRLLEWNPSSNVDRALEHRDRTDLLSSYRRMAIAPVIAVAAALGVSATNVDAMLFAGPILLLWAASPAIAWWVSRPLPRRSNKLTREQRLFLRKLARKTWGYFETYVTDGGHWLPPDNVQEHPAIKVAHRTSPTNMGLALLADLAAHDFGYLSTGRLIARTARTLRAMESLERHRGHFYNWYDTETAVPLSPLYVSTVDSGNLAGHLMTLVPGLASLRDAPILNERWIDGMADTLRILIDCVGVDQSAAVARFATALDLAAALPSPTLVDQWNHIDMLATFGAHIAAGAAARTSSDESDDVAWAHALASQCADLRDELVFLAPWLRLQPTSTDPQVPGDKAIPTLRELANTGLPSSPSTVPGSHATLREGQDPLSSLLALGAERARERIRTIDQLALAATALSDMDYDFLFDEARRQLVIGYNVSEGRCDAGHYDLLASEARLCNFVAIAQGKLPQESWFALGRLLTSVGGEPALLAWTGSMFEYLMPLLVMPSYENTLLDKTCIAAVERQIEYARQRAVPWGISESGYNAVDAQLNYQYRAFGVPGLGLKRGLGDDLVVAPYASALALMVAPEAACVNLQRLAAEGLAGRFGLFEAIDYTPVRQRRGESSTIVRSYMAHHQGMTLLACASVLLARPMQRRFASDPLCQATLLLLQERIPRAAPLHLAANLSQRHAAERAAEAPVRVLAADTPSPEVQLLSNGRYHVMVTNAGGGSSRWKDLAITRWREDTTSDNWGTFCYLRCEATGEFWSAAHQPTLRRAETYEAIFSEGRAEFRRRDFDFDTHTEIVVSPEDDVEVRRLHVTNRSRASRTIEVTSYTEVVLAPAAADALHPAFSNLFVETEIIRKQNAIVCTRRPRSLEERVPWMFHLMTVHSADTGAISFETDRARFIGRGRTLAAPIAMTTAGALSGSHGSVLDPVAAIRGRITIGPGSTAVLDMVTGAGDDRGSVLHLIDKYQDRGLADRAFELTWSHSQVALGQLNATEADSQLYARLASSVIYANGSLRPVDAVLVGNRRTQSGLWGYAISGDLPIVLLQIASAANIDLVRQLVQAHAYWRQKGLAVDLVIWNEDREGYRQLLQEQIVGLVAAGVEAHAADRPGGIFVRHAEQISSEDRVLFQSVARAIISDSRGSLADQIHRRAGADVRIPRFEPTRPYRRPASRVEDHEPGGDLILFNGTGGFTPDGCEYVISAHAAHKTPTPWVNVIANPGFGTVLSESGLGYTWSENAHLFRLTPWHNDPITDASGEALYLRDEESGHFWSPTASPCGGDGAYVTRHGFGRSVFEHVEDGVRSKLTVFVAADAPVKFYTLVVGNHSDRARRLSATGYVEWVLGDSRSKSAMHVTTEIDTNGALYARKPYSSEFADSVAFFDVDDSRRTVTGDRTEFLGRNGSSRDPAAMHRTRLSGKVGAALDPCGAMQVSFELLEGEEREIVFTLGAAAGTEAARALVQRFRGSAVARESLDAVEAHSRHVLTAVQIRTPDPALNVLTNGWLLYQTIASRLWARSGFYQSGGAYGFRDQLQDVMALVHAEPGLLRAQIALCASR